MSVIYVIALYIYIYIEFFVICKYRGICLMLYYICILASNFVVVVIVIKTSSGDQKKIKEIQRERSEMVYCVCIECNNNLFCIVKVTKVRLNLKGVDYV